MAENFATQYGVDPWEKISTNQRTWYDPILRQCYRGDTVYANGLVQYAYQPMLPMNATEMVFNMVMDFEPTIGAIPLRHTNLPRAGLDGKQVKVNFTRYGFTTGYDKYDAAITYWRNNGGGNNPSALAPLVSERIGRQMTVTMDRLIRNAFLQTPYIRLARTGATGAGQLTSGDKFDLAMVDDVILRSKYQNVWTNNVGGGTGGRTLMCIGSPGHEYDIVNGPVNSRWIELRKYTDPSIIQNYEIGAYHNSRHFSTPANTLWNCGAVEAQTTLAASHSFRDGAPDPLTDKVDGSYYVGQPGTDGGNLKHYIQLASNANMTQWNEGDFITIHKRKVQTAEAAAAPKLKVAGGVPYDDPDLVERRVVGKDVGNKRLILSEPLLRDFNVEVDATGTGAASPSSGVYGFVTKGLSLHVNIMMSAPDGVVCAVLNPPRFYGPRTLDLMESYWEVGWDAYMKYQMVKPEAYEVLVTAGSARVVGSGGIFA